MDKFEKKFEKDLAKLEKHEAKTWEKFLKELGRLKATGEKIAATDSQFVLKFEEAKGAAEAAKAFNYLKKMEHYGKKFVYEVELDEEQLQKVLDKHLNELGVSLNKLYADLEKLDFDDLSKFKEYILNHDISHILEKIGKEVEEIENA